MIVRGTLLSLRLLSVLALLIGLAFPGESQGQTKPKTHPPTPKKPGKTPAVLTEAVMLQEVVALRQAYVLLAAGNHDYDGHRVKAMDAVQAAAQILYDHLMRQGNARQKAAAAKEKAAIAAAREAMNRVQMLHEPQATSDRQLRKAAEILVELRPTVVAHKQKKVLEHVDRAVKEIGIALAIR
jgi:hypothetical protein